MTRSPLRRILTRLFSRTSWSEPKATPLTRDGAWCWFADPRTIRFTGERDCIYVGFVSSDGDIIVVQHDLDTQESVSATVRSGLDRNDHANPALMMSEDGRLSVFYSAHNGASMHLRSTVDPEDLSTWSKETSLDLNTGDYERDSYTYPNPVRLAAEQDRLHLFWRGDHWKPTTSTSADGQTWERARILIMEPDAPSNSRPYMKVGTDGLHSIHFAFTDGHPHVEEHNNIYYMGYRDGIFRRANGTTIAPPEGLPLSPRATDLVFDAHSHGARSWIWDIASEGQDDIAIVFAAFPTSSAHSYYYSRWDGKRWSVSELVVAGGWFPSDVPGREQTEPYYSGGIALDHDDINTVYMSRSVRGIFEIERWKTKDRGLTWTHSAITSNSSDHNVRPCAIRNHGKNGPTVMWMRLDGHYNTYKDFLTSLHMA